LSDVTSSTFGIQEGSVLSNAGGFVTSATGDMASIVNFTPLNFGTITALNDETVSFTSDFGDFIGTIQDLMASPAPNAVVSFSSFGNFTPSGSLGSFMEGPGLLTVSFTQTGFLVEGQTQPSISGSFSFASEPGDGTPGIVPEPAAWAMLIAGFGLTGVAMRRRERMSVAA
jgi:hypothetical protein